MSKNLLLAALGLVAGAVILVIGFLLFNQTTLHGTQIDPPKEMADFTLTSDSGPVRLSSLRGKLVVMYFGYTFCPDICPATLSKINQALGRIGAEAGEVVVVMVTVDPERDTAEKLGTYVRRFNPNFLGLTGSPEEIAAVAREFGIFYEKTEVSTSAGYLVDHTASVLILDREGRIALIWPYGLETADMASDLRTLAKRR